MCYVFMSAYILPCPEDTVFLRVLSTSDSYNLFIQTSMMVLMPCVKVYDILVLFVAEYLFLI